MKNIHIIYILLILCSCTNSEEKTESSKNSNWKKDTQVSKNIKNVNFIFPSHGYAFDNRELLVNDCFDAIKENSELINLTEFNDTIYIRFLSSRKESKMYTGQKSSGSAWPHIKTLYVVANENQKPPIKHELMHLMSMLEWGYEAPTSNWVNEGLGTFAGNKCNGYNVAQIYRYLMQHDKLIPIDLLTSDFYNQSEMIAYHQAAYIVEYLLINYNVDQLKRLWIEGFSKFEEIYNISFSKVKQDLEKVVTVKYPTAPHIDWKKFNEGCN